MTREGEPKGILATLSFSLFESEDEFKRRNSRIHFRTKSETLFRPIIP